MLKPEQKERLEELKSKDALNEEEQSELTGLEELEPANPEDTEFDDAWETDEFDKGVAQKDNKDDEGNADQDDEDKGKDQSKEKANDADREDSDSIFNNSPEDKSDDQDTDGEDDEDLEDDNPAKQIAELEAKLAKESQRTASWEGRIRAAEKKAKEAERKLKGKDKGQGDSDAASLTEDDPELSDFFQEFPDLEKPILKVAERVAKQIVDARIGKVEESVGEVRDTLREESNHKHRETILEAHPDFEKIYTSGALTTWINRQPKYLQSALNGVVESGSTEEIIELYDSYKKSARVKSSTTNTSSSENSTGKKRSKSTRKQDIEAVPASSAGPKANPKGPAKDDFDGAWEHFTKEDEKK